MGGGGTEVPSGTSGLVSCGLWFSVVTSVGDGPGWRRGTRGWADPSEDRGARDAAVRGARGGRVGAGTRRGAQQRAWPPSSAGSCVRVRGKQAISGWQAISSSLVAALTHAGLLVTQAAASGGAGCQGPSGGGGALSPAHPSACSLCCHGPGAGLPNAPLPPSLFASPPCLVLR